MLGNHDRRGPFAQVFPEHSAAFQQGHQDFSATRIIYLDTMDENAPNKHSGLMCPARLSWLQAQLEAGQGPMIVLAHTICWPQVLRVWMKSSSAMVLQWLR